MNGCGSDSQIERQAVRSGDEVRDGPRTADAGMDE